MASPVSLKEGMLVNKSHSVSSKKKDDLSRVRGAIAVPVSAPNSRKKWEKGNDENVRNAARGVVGGNKMDEAPPVFSLSIRKR